MWNDATKKVSKSVSEANQRDAEATASLRKISTRAGNLICKTGKLLGNSINKVKALKGRVVSTQRDLVGACGVVNSMSARVSEVHQLFVDVIKGISESRLLRKYASVSNGDIRERIATFANASENVVKGVEELGRKIAAVELNADKLDKGMLVENGKILGLRREFNSLLEKAGVFLSASSDDNCFMSNSNDKRLLKVKPEAIRVLLECEVEAEGIRHGITKLDDVAVSRSQLNNIGKRSVSMRGESASITTSANDVETAAGGVLEKTINLLEAVACDTKKQLGAIEGNLTLFIREALDTRQQAIMESKRATGAASEAVIVASHSLDARASVEEAGGECVKTKVTVSEAGRNTRVTTHGVRKLLLESAERRGKIRTACEALLRSTTGPSAVATVVGVCHADENITAAVTRKGIAPQIWPK
ncbi:hypothetical protein TRVL_07968 [Trypanosoma vivax]|nr:hypothetical protein TRVL_07968 [Trypanosoma vivax]